MPRAQWAHVVDPVIGSRGTDMVGANQRDEKVGKVYWFLREVNDVRALNQ